jgi:hypothetical protein
MRRHPPLIKPSPRFARVELSPREFFQFPFPFVFCLPNLLSRNVFSLFAVAAAIASLLLLLPRPRSVSLFLVFSSLPESSLSPAQSPPPPPLTSHFARQTSTQIQSSNSIHRVARRWSCCSRYLNFILMFVPSINFYNPSINLIKNKTQRQSSCSLCSRFDSTQPHPE